MIFYQVQSVRQQPVSDPWQRISHLLVTTSPTAAPTPMSVAQVISVIESGRAQFSVGGRATVTVVERDGGKTLSTNVDRDTPNTLLALGGGASGLGGRTSGGPLGRF